MKKSTIIMTIILAIFAGLAAFTAICFYLGEPDADDFDDFNDFIDDEDLNQAETDTDIATESGAFGRKYIEVNTSK